MTEKEYVACSKTLVHVIADHFGLTNEDSIGMLLERLEWMEKLMETEAGGDQDLADRWG